LDCSSASLDYVVGISNYISRFSVLTSTEYEALERILLVINYFLSSHIKASDCAVEPADKTSRGLNQLQSRVTS